MLRNKCRVTLSQAPRVTPPVRSTFHPHPSSSNLTCPITSSRLFPPFARAAIYSTCHTHCLTREMSLDNVRCSRILAVEHNEVCQRRLGLHSHQVLLDRRVQSGAARRVRHFPPVIAIHLSKYLTRNGGLRVNPGQSCAGFILIACDPTALTPMRTLQRSG